MGDSFRLTQISTIVYLITKVKHLSNSINSFLQGINSNLDIPVNFPEYVEYYGEKQAQIALDKAAGKFLGLSAQGSQIKAGDYLLPQPKVDLFLADVKTLDDLAKSLDLYLQAFPKIQKKLVEYYEPKILGSLIPSAEMPCHQAEDFIRKFHEVLNQPQNLPYLVTPFHLNGKLQILFAGKEEAEEYARKLSPAEVWHRREDGSGLEEVGSY